MALTEKQIKRMEEQRNQLRKEIDYYSNDIMSTHKEKMSNIRDFIKEYRDKIDDVEKQWSKNEHTEETLKMYRESIHHAIATQKNLIKDNFVKKNTELVADISKATDSQLNHLYLKNKNILKELRTKNSLFKESDTDNPHKQAFEELAKETKTNIRNIVRKLSENETKRVIEAQYSVSSSFEGMRGRHGDLSSRYVEVTSPNNPPNPPKPTYSDSFYTGAGRHGSLNRILPVAQNRFEQHQQNKRFIEAQQRPILNYYSNLRKNGVDNSESNNNYETQRVGNLDLRKKVAENLLADKDYQTNAYTTEKERLENLKETANTLSEKAEIERQLRELDKKYIDKMMWMTSAQLQQLKEDVALEEELRDKNAEKVDKLSEQHWSDSSDKTFTLSDYLTEKEKANIEKLKWKLNNSKGEESAKVLEEYKKYTASIAENLDGMNEDQLKKRKELLDKKREYEKNLQDYRKNLREAFLDPFKGIKDKFAQMKHSFNKLKVFGSEMWNGLKNASNFIFRTKFKVNRQDDLKAEETLTEEQKSTESLKEAKTGNKLLTKIFGALTGQKKLMEDTEDEANKDRDEQQKTLKKILVSSNGMPSLMGAILGPLLIAAIGASLYTWLSPKLEKSLDIDKKVKEGKLSKEELAKLDVNKGGILEGSGETQYSALRAKEDAGTLTKEEAEKLKELRKTNEEWKESHNGEGDWEETYKKAKSNKEVTKPSRKELSDKLDKQADETRKQDNQPVVVQQNNANSTTNNVGDSGGQSAPDMNVYNSDSSFMSFIGGCLTPH